MTAFEKLDTVFKLQQSHAMQLKRSSYKDRIEKLNRLKILLENKYRDLFCESLKKDLSKPSVETDLTEIYPVIKEIKYVKRHLKSWLSKNYVSTPMVLLGSQSYTVYEPKGVCLIMSPWNFPVNLTLSPLISAIAAGNTVIIKPSEMSSYTSAVLKELIEELFDENEVFLIEGDVEVAQHLLKLPFNHIFFTGSPEIGRLVMKAASDHLASVTLELGGKSPVIIDNTANLKLAVSRVVHSKLINTGQTCIAPDYVFVHKSIFSAFVKQFEIEAQKLYSKQSEASSDYGRIINQKHFSRLKALISDLETGEVKFGGLANDSELYFEPTLVAPNSSSSKIKKEEIFGPILAVYSFEDLNEVVDYVNKNERPLALYIFSKSKKNIDKVISETTSGGTCINHCLLHYMNSELPFGGVNNSGIGKSHGKYGFEAFSNKRAVLHQFTFSAVDLIKPPYTNFMAKLARLTVKWF